MDFQLNDEQLQLRKSVREFAEREIRPHVMEWDEASRFPLETVKELGRLGLMGAIFPPEYGGAGMGYIEYVLAIEELSRVDGSIGIIVAAHTSLCTNHIFVAGSEEQKRKYVPKLATGEYIGAWGLTEPGSGSDAGSARMTAVRTRQLLGAERHQDVHHQRPLRRCRGRSRRHRQGGAHPRAVGVHRRERHARASGRARKRTSSACAPATPPN